MASALKLAVGCLRRSYRYANAAANNFHTSTCYFGEVKTVKTPGFPESVTVGDIRWKKAVGDSVAAGGVIGEVKTDKVSIAVTAPAAGVVAALLVEDGGIGQDRAEVELGMAGTGISAKGQPGEVSVPSSNAEQCRTGPVVVFDIEASRLSLYHARILQLSASVYRPEHSDFYRPFNCWILPPGIIPLRISRLLNLSIGYICGRRCLKKNGRVVPTVSAVEGLRSFIDWLPKSSVLCGHCAAVYDETILWREAELASLGDELCSKVAGFSDTLPLLKSKLPGRASYSLDKLVKDFLRNDFDAHNSMADVDALIAVMQKADVQEEDLQAIMRPSHDSWRMSQQRRSVKIIKTELLLLSKREIISKAFAEKLALNGMSYRCLHGAFQDGGEDGLSAFIRERFGTNVQMHSFSDQVNALAKHFSRKRNLKWSRKCDSAISP